MISRIIATICAVMLLANYAWAQDAGTANDAQTAQQTVTSPADDAPSASAPASQTKLVFSGRRVLNDCDKFKYPLLGVLFLGLFLGLFQAGMLYMESRRSKSLKDMPLQNASDSDIGKQIESSRGQSELGHLLSMLFALHTEGNGGEEDFHNEVAHAAKVRQERFGTFRNWMTFLSDSAGALGLLGTVVGMYTTFYGGTLSGEQILAGMGIALSTTLVGIIISIILNLTVTLLGNIFDRQLEVTYNKAEELRFALKARPAPANVSPLAGSVS
jgi:biopolymer transport protein ExbB/TolQ